MFWGFEFWGSGCQSVLVPVILPSPLMSRRHNQPRGACGYRTPSVLHACVVYYHSIMLFTGQVTVLHNDKCLPITDKPTVCLLQGNKQWLDMTVAWSGFGVSKMAIVFRNFELTADRLHVQNAIPKIKFYYQHLSTVRSAYYMPSPAR